MNTIHNNGENDKSLSAGLDKLSHEYGLLEQDEPPELLDQAILNSAHRAVEKKPHWMKFSWLHGLTTAAVFVLAFSIILNQREQVPDYETGMRNNEPVRLERQKVAKKQSSSQFEEQPKEPGSEMEVKSDYRTDMLQSRPAAAPAREFILEEELMDEADLMADSPDASAFSKVARPAVVGETAAGEAKARVRADSELEQILQAIIKLKQSGDESWKTELESFKESYPDYPLPEELTD